MPDAHDPAALIAHAVAARGWRLVELIARTFSGQPSTPSRAARRAYGTPRRQTRPEQQSRPKRSQLMEKSNRPPRISSPASQLRLGRCHAASPIEEIADTYVGLLVRDVEDLGTAPGARELGHGQALSGLLLPAVGDIWVNAEEARQWPARRRFTIAHELGHWRLHRDAERGVFCRSGSVEPEAPQTRVALPRAEARPTCLRPRC